MTKKRTKVKITREELIAVLIKIWEAAGSNVFGDKLCPIHGPQCPESCELRSILHKIRGVREHMK